MFVFSVEVRMFTDFKLFGSEDVISYDDFVLLLSTGTIRLYSNVAAGSTKNETISEK
jgi:hypothetical protein